MSRRGALIVLEGLDRVGKSTHVSMIFEALKERGIPAEKGSFPDRSTVIGRLINDYLKKKIELAPEAVQLLFSANRWECQQRIIDSLKKGTTLVLDRYVHSGSAYGSATTGRALSWCRAPDRGLAAPDLVVYLHVAEAVQQQRANWGEERYERTEMQRKVLANFNELVEPESWFCVETSPPKETVHGCILEKVLAAIEEAKAKEIRILE